MSNCIGSGYCCHKSLCFDGLAKHGNIQGPCPSLVWDEEAQRHWCGLVLDGEITGKSLYIGEGCCSSLNTWRVQPLKDRTVPERISMIENDLKFKKRITTYYIREVLGLTWDEFVSEWEDLSDEDKEWYQEAAKAERKFIGLA